MSAWHAEAAGAAAWVTPDVGAFASGAAAGAPASSDRAAVACRTHTPNATHRTRAARIAAEATTLPERKPVAHFTFSATWIARWSDGSVAEGSGVTSVIGGSTFGVASKPRV